MEISLLHKPGGCNEGQSFHPKAQTNLLGYVCIIQDSNSLDNMYNVQLNRIY